MNKNEQEDSYKWNENAQDWKNRVKSNDNDDDDDVIFYSFLYPKIN